MVKGIRQNTGHVLMVKLAKLAAKAMHETNRHVTQGQSVPYGPTGVSGPSVALRAVNHKWSDAVNVSMVTRAMSAAKVMMPRPKSVSGLIASALHGRRGQISHHARFVVRFKGTKTK